MTVQQEVATSPDPVLHPPLPSGATADSLILRDPYGDPALRCAPGERLHHLFENVVDRMAEAGATDRIAVDILGGEPLSYADLEAESNRWAHLLLERGVRPGARVALLLADPVLAYPALLAVQKVCATHVPLDPDGPAERLHRMLQDARAEWVLACTPQVPLVQGGLATVIDLDDAAVAIGTMPTDRPTVDPGNATTAYLGYLPPADGRPTAAAISQAAIVNAVKVAADVFGLSGQDRTYQGSPITEVGSIAEIWLTLALGGTLVPRPPGPALRGRPLYDFLASQRATALWASGSMLAELPSDLPTLRFIALGDGSCSPDLVRQWARPGRRLLSVFSSVETGSGALWTSLRPGDAGLARPLPTFSALVLDPATAAVMPRGSVGELAIGGVSIADGYPQRPDLTAAIFIPDPVGLASNPSGRIFRTQHLVRSHSDGRIEFLDRLHRTPVDAGPAEAEPAAPQAAQQLQPPSARAVVARSTSAASKPAPTSRSPLRQAGRWAAVLAITVFVTALLVTGLRPLISAEWGLPYLRACLAALLLAAAATAIALSVHRFLGDATPVSGSAAADPLRLRARRQDVAAEPVVDPAGWAAGTADTQTARDQNVASSDADRQPDDARPTALDTPAAHPAGATAEPGTRSESDTAPATVAQQPGPRQFSQQPPEHAELGKLALPGGELTSATVHFPLLGASVAVLDLAGAGLRGVADPAGLAGRGVPTGLLTRADLAEVGPDDTGGSGVSALARILTRLLLSREIDPGSEPGAWRFLRGADDGAIVYWPSHPGASWAERDDTLVVAVGAEPVGVDLATEFTAAQAGDLLSADRHVNAAERRAFAALGAAELPVAVTRCLSLKRATARALGHGSLLDPADLTARLAPVSVRVNDTAGLRTRLACAQWPLRVGNAVCWVSVVVVRTPLTTL